MQVPIHQQETPYTCAVACLRMVLEYHGVAQSEADLSALCQTTRDGTTAYDVANAARQSGFEAIVCEAEWPLLQTAILNNEPVIASLALEHITVIPGDDLHSVVVVRVIPDTVTVIDPLAGEEIDVPRSEFARAWAELDNLCVLIAPTA